MQNNQSLVRYFSPILIIGLFFSPLFILRAQTSPNYDYTLVPQDFSFTRDLSFGDRDPVGQNDIKYLQCVLGIIPPSGYFGDITKANLTQFQKDHFEEILSPAGLTKEQATGFFGSSTRNYINAQIAVEGSTAGAQCGGTQTEPTINNLPQGCVTASGFSTITGTRCNTGSTNNNNQQANSNNQNPLQSLLPFLPFFLSQGGRMSLVNPSGQNTSTGAGNTSVSGGYTPPSGPNGSGGSTGSGSTGYTGQGFNPLQNSPQGLGNNPFPADHCTPPKYFSYPLQVCVDPTSGQTAPGAISNGAQQGSNPPGSNPPPDPTFFGGTTLYNSEFLLSTGSGGGYTQIDSNTHVPNRPCNASPNTYLYVNQNEALNYNPVFLLIKHPETDKVLDLSAHIGTCVIGKTRPLLRGYDNCLTYTSPYPNLRYELDRTFTPLITGVVTKIQAAEGGQNGACVPNPQ